MKKFFLIAMLLLFMSAVFAQTNAPWHNVQIVDERGVVVTSITSVEIYAPDTTTDAVIFSDRGLNNVMVIPITEASDNTTLVDGVLSWYGPDGYDFSITDGTNVLTNANHRTRDATEGTLVFPSYITSITTSQYLDDESIQFGTSPDWTVNAGNETDVITWTPTSDNAEFRIGVSGTSKNATLNLYVGTAIGLKIDSSVPSFIWDGGAASINASSNFATNINTGTSTGAVNICNGSGTGTIGIGNSAAGTISFDTDSTITVNSDGQTSITTTDSLADIVVTATLGRTTIFGGENAADAILLEVDNDTASRMRVFNDTGTGASAATESDASIQVQSDVGGIGLLSGLNGDNSIRLEANGGENENIILHSNQGTGQDSVNFLTDVGGVKVTASAVPDGQYGLEVSSAIAGATKSEGAAIYAHTTLTGNTDAPTYNLGSWFDITAGTPTAGVIAAIDCGIFETGADLSGVQWLVGLQIQTLMDNTNGPANHAMMRFNTSQAGDTPDFWFVAANAESVAYSANSTHTSASTSKVGAIKIHIIGPGDVFLYVYDHAGE